MIMGNLLLEIKNEIKFLSDSNISFKTHLRYLAEKSALNLMTLRAVRPYMDNKTMSDTYYTFLYPHIIYGIQFWGHASQSAIKPIIVLQKAVLRVILNIKTRKHVTSHFKNHANKNYL